MNRKQRRAKLYRKPQGMNTKYFHPTDKRDVTIDSHSSIREILVWFKQLPHDMKVSLLTMPDDRAEGESAKDFMDRRHVQHVLRRFFKYVEKENTESQIETAEPEPDAATLQTLEP